MRPNQLPLCAVEEALSMKHGESIEAVPHKSKFNTVQASNLAHAKKCELSQSLMSDVYHKC